MSWDPDGLEASPAFRAYVADLRETWPAKEDQEGNHGVAAGNGHSTIDMSESQSGETDGQALTTDMERRAFMIAAGATFATAATAGVATASEVLDRDSDYIHDPTLAGSVTISEHDRQLFDSALEFVDDSGNLATLADAGGVVAHDADEPNNPISLRADLIDADEYREFPRGETYEDADGDEQDLSAIDARHWSVDESGTAGSLTVVDTSAASGGDALRVAASDQTSGDVATATFDDFTIDSGEPRKRLQLVATIDELADAAAVYVRARDESGSVTEAWIDHGADETADGTIATGAESGVVYQQGLGELDSDLDTIEEIEIAVEDGDADVTIAGLNLERESEWSFGTREFENEDDEIETETIEETSGRYSITSVDSLDDNVFSSVTIADLEVDVEFSAGEIDADGVTDHEFEDADRYDQDERLNDLVGWDLPSAYDLSYGTLTFRDTVKYPSSRYLKASYATGLDELPSLEDDRDDWSDATATYEGGSIDDEITLSADVSGGQTIGWFANVLMNDGETDAGTMSSGGIGGGATSATGGFGTVRSLLTTVVLTGAGYLAYLRGMIPGVGGS